jgi:hypothetical protein
MKTRTEANRDVFGKKYFIKIKNDLGRALYFI